ncbi:S26 family signal peptidase [Candidatus Pacearchaeota archaeon]|nr:S26 family signal peptidase [Candidatus Pacearchaeota archaeon]
MRKIITQKKEKTAFQKIWDFLWKSNSIWSWIVDLILLYIFVKFIFFPLLALIFGASLPSVIVESQSMYHGTSFDQWWYAHGFWYEQKNMTKEQVYSWGYHNGITRGDIIVVFGIKEPKIGDIIIFNAGERLPIIHRVVNLTPIQTKGDNNDGQLGFEKNIKKEQIVGKAVLKIPKLGWIKLIFVDLINSFKG